MTTETASTKIRETERVQSAEVTMDALMTQLEPLLRRIVREELENFAVQEPAFFHLTEDSPLYEDLLRLQEQKTQGQLKLYSYGEVFGD